MQIRTAFVSVLQLLWLKRRRSCFVVWWLSLRDTLIWDLIVFAGKVLSLVRRVKAMRVDWSVNRFYCVQSVSTYPPGTAGLWGEVAALIIATSRFITWCTLSPIHNHWKRSGSEIVNTFFWESQTFKQLSLFWVWSIRSINIWEV